MEAPVPVSLTSSPLAPAESLAPSRSHQIWPTPQAEVWRGEGRSSAPDATPAFLTELRSKLRRCFGDKEPDAFGPIYAALVALAPQCTEAERRSLRGLLPHLHPFTSLIADEERHTLVAIKFLHAQHRALKGYHLVERKLHDTVAEATTPAFLEQLRALQEHYQACLKKLLSSSDREAFLKPKAQLWHHGFFLIDRTLARKLLSCNEAGKIARLNPYGSRPVVQHHGMHLKVGAEGFPELDPASEAAVSSLCHLFSPKIMTAAPTSLFYVRMPGRCEALVQASLSVGGGKSRLPLAIPLNELLDMFNSFDLLKAHFGSLTSFQKNWKGLLSWAIEQSTEVSPPDVLKNYLEWMKAVPSKDRSREFMEPDDLPERERPLSFFFRDSWGHQFSQFQDYLRNYSPLVWAKLLELLKRQPTLMKGRSIRPLLRIHRSMIWISRLFPTGSFDQTARQLTVLLDRVDQDALSRLFLASLAVNPHDGKADNYMVSIDWSDQGIARLTIVGIDNDLAFEPSVMKAGKSHHLCTKCLLYALPPGLLKKPIPITVRRQFRMKSVEELALQWLTHLDRQDQFYGQLMKAGLTGQDLSLKLPDEALATAIDKLLKIHELLKKEVTLEEVFREVEPVAFYAYREACHRTSNGKDALSLLGWKSGEPLEEILKSSFAMVRLEDSTVSLDEAYRKLAKGSFEKRGLCMATQLALKKLTLTRAHAVSLSNLSFFDQLEVALKSPQKLLVQAIRNLDLPLARIALSSGAKPNQRDAAGDSAILNLIPFPDGDRERGEQMLKLLVKHGADLDQKDLTNGETLLDFAARQSFVEEFMVLISHGSGREVQAASALAFARAYIAIPEMKEALEALETRSPQVSWLQDLSAMLLSREEFGSLPLHRAQLKRSGKTSKGKERASLGYTTKVEIARTHLHPAVAKQIGITADKRFPAKKKRQYGRHTTKSIEHEKRKITFKDRPEMAGNEFLVGSLHRKLIGHGTPETELFKAYDRFGRPYPVLASQTVPGPNFRDVLYGPDAATKLAQLDLQYAHNMILMAILTDPEDGKPENYIFTPSPDKGFQLFCVDNDHAFVSPFDRKRLMIKCVLFCLDQMQVPIHGQTRQLFLKLNVEEVLKSWLHECAVQNRLYTALFNEPERESQFNASQRDPIIIQMFLPPRTTAKIYEKIGRIQEALSERDVTPLDLLLYARPELGRYYQQLFAPRYKTPKDRWQQVKKAGGYLRDSSGGDRTRTSTLDLLKHFGIEPQKLLKLNPAYFIDQAQVELVRLRMEQTEISAITERLPRGRIDGFKRLLLDHSREKALRGYTFGQSSSRDRKILAAMAESKSSFLHLSFARKMEFSVGSAFEQVKQVCFFSPSLRSLALDRCADVTGSFFWSLSGLCRHLIRLSFVECQNLREVWGKFSWLTFPNLEHLDLRGSGLRRFLLGAPKLTLLDLSDCKALKQLSVDLPALQRMKLDGCTGFSLSELKRVAKLAKSGRISATRCPALRNLIRRTVVEQHLPLIFESLDSLDEEVVQGLHGLVVNRVRTIKLDRQRIAEDDDGWFVDVDTKALKGVQALVRVFHLNTSLTSLSLGENRIGYPGARSLAKGLCQHSSLLSLNLADNKIKDRGARALAQALRRNSSLQRLFLWKNSIGGKGAKAIGQAVVNNSSLLELDLSDNKIGALGAEALAQALHRNSCLTSLLLTNNSVGGQGAEMLAEALKHNSSLQHLWLLRNKIGERGAEALAQALKCNSSLKLLDIKGNSIGDRGAITLAQALRHSSSLTLLSLDNNSIGDWGAGALAEGLTHNSSLTQLELNRNSIGSMGAQALAQALKHSTSLTFLEITDNDIGAQGVQSFKEAVEYRKKRIQGLNHGGNIEVMLTQNSENYRVALTRRNPPQT